MVKTSNIYNSCYKLLGMHNSIRTVTSVRLKAGSTLPTTLSKIRHQTRPSYWIGGRGPAITATDRLKRSGGVIEEIWMNNPSRPIDQAARHTTVISLEQLIFQSNRMGLSLNNTRFKLKFDCRIDPSRFLDRAWLARTPHESFAT
jgi:hypothetical protein